jgi:type IV pilus biogenesis protein CpaD/CtpE
MKHPGIPIAVSLCALLSLAGCTPTIKVEAPDKPIEINMNVKIEHEIRLKIEQDVDELITHKQGLF